MTCDDCIHKAVCYRTDSVSPSYADKCGDFGSEKTGYWIEHPHEAGPCWEYSRYECSECHEWAEDDSDYCPDCGAKMVESQESEDKE